MKLSHNEICNAIIAIGAEYDAIDSVQFDTHLRLAELKLARWIAGQWKLTTAGRNLLTKLLRGEHVILCE